MKKKLLFICTHNSARSQMAEGLVNHFWKDRCQAFSAGTQPGIVNPFAIKVMKEQGIDISNARSKNASKFIGKAFDLVVTVCDSAKEICPFFPGAKEYIHKGFPDPSQAKGDENEIIAAFRKMRDDIYIWLKNILD
ncbi:MAG: arsenate reductase ArsC [Candidatus Aminicenantes bacterium]|nr:arsenate reductase ArsC [Candidatus Aminicenantes bacterium]NIM79746.1 arsenate reductase ArsC [Candidatus Aminicenantes bacterium]NIN19077.1 arsenate reductase ArsC [Candidatus Aminicenantes bacterium]NIN42979.1 arsenate reductase ArsC [Candidatus Aminicenantes bacterium]NIN85722.1 arsenate reductase ArsC [Candidatus Aminicenantes bacterium]